MRICYVSTGKAWGGGERLLAALITALIARGIEVSLVARRDSPLAVWARQQKTVPLLELPGRGRTPWSLWRLRRWLNRRADVVVFNDPHAISTGVIVGLGLKAWQLGVRHTVFPLRSTWKHNRLDALVCVSAAAERECLAAGIPQRRISVIHGGVPRSKLCTDRLQRVRQMFGEHGDKNILAIGSLLPVKGFDTIIRSVAQGYAPGRPWRLWIAGEGPLRDSLGELARELGVHDRVHFLGFRNDIGELLSEADVFVSASHSEGLSLVLIEAMLARCPIVSTAVGGAREVLGIDEHGEALLAEIFAPGDADGLTTAIERALPATPSSQVRLGRAKHWALDHFSVDQMAEGHLALYSKLLAIDPPLRRAAA